MKGKAVLRLALTIMVTALASQATAEVPSLVSYQGRLLDSNGDPFVGTTNVTFRIYDLPSDGTLIWEETQSVVFDDNGLFSVLLGEDYPLTDDVFVDPVRWLGVQVQGDQEVSPRRRIVSVAYSHRSSAADRVGTIDGASGGTILGDVSIQSDLAVDGAIDATGMESKIRFHYNTLGELPDANLYHGMFAHVHAEGRAYYAHAGQWVPVTDENNPHAVTSADIVDGTIASVDLGDGSVTTAKMNDLAVTEEKIGDNAVITRTIQDGAVTQPKMAPNSVGGPNIVDGAVITSKIQDLNVTNQKIADDGVTTEKILGGTIQFSDIGQNGAASGQVMKWNGAAWVADDDQTGGGGGGGWIDDGTVVRLETSTDSVGIGTATPTEKLDVAGNIIVSGKATIGPSHTNTGTSAFVAGQGNSATAIYTSVSGGVSNIASGDNSTISGGNGNTASGFASAVSGGANNTADGDRSAVGGGYENTAANDGSTIGGGTFNDASAWKSTVGGGAYNNARGNYSVVSGGGGATEADSNAAIGAFSAIGGGSRNIASDSAATVGGGRYNKASGKYSVVAGGGGPSIFDPNEATGDQSAIGGGRANIASGEASTVSGGYDNTASANNSTVGGGRRNNATSISSTVAGGQQNNASTGTHNFVGGGRENAAVGTYSAVLCGYQNYAQASYSVNLGGNQNIIFSSADFSLAFGSFVNVAQPYRVVFFDGATSGRFGLNRDWNNGGISYPIHVGTSASNGNGAYLTGGGTWTNGSSRTFKENGRPFEGQQLLEKISTLPVETWQYKDSDEQHIGPYAEDFVGAFDVGTVRDADGQRENKYLAASDVAGVALAGIQALLDKVEQLEARIAKLEAGGR